MGCRSAGRAVPGWGYKMAFSQHFIVLAVRRAWRSRRRGPSHIDALGGNYQRMISPAVITPRSTGTIKCDVLNANGYHPVQDDGVYCLRNVLHHMSDGVFHVIAENIGAVHTSDDESNKATGRSTSGFGANAG